jgi:hypothetical protein
MVETATPVTWPEAMAVPMTPEHARTLNEAYEARRRAYTEAWRDYDARHFLPDQYVSGELY